MSRPASGPRAEREASPAAIWAALVAVYIVWGSTYLAIKLTVQTIPPFLSASVRFLVAGALLYLFSIRRGDRREDRPRAIHWRSAAIIGTALLLGGNGFVVLAEERIPSGLASLVVATVPLWMVFFRFAILRESVGWKEAAGLLIGFGGLALLVGPIGAGRVDLVGAGMVLFASVSWAAGSLYARRAPLPSRPLVGTSMEMLAGGVALLVVAAAAGELGDLDLGGVSAASLWGLGFLIVFGSWVGFAAYVWLLRNARTSLVSTYAYVNPVVAVFLGWAVLEEVVTLRTFLAGGVILAGVAMIVAATSRPTEEAPGEPAEAAPAADQEEPEELSA
ncbi:MAG TPA: EamA family transporter [Actinomycetota bacterium]|nr:EamA family transporter [Actinomycetota bacterium]